MHVPSSSMIAWRSEPPSTWMPGPNGYGAWSLSLAYRKRIFTFGWDGATTSNGIP